MASWDKMIDLGNYGQSNHNWGGMHINPAVFFPTAFISFAVIMFSLIAPKASADLFAALRGGAVQHFDWFFMMSGNLLLWRSRRLGKFDWAAKAQCLLIRGCHGSRCCSARGWASG